MLGWYNEIKGALVYDLKNKHLKNKKNIYTKDQFIFHSKEFDFKDFSSVGT